MLLRRPTLSSSLHGCTRPPALYAHPALPPHQVCLAPWVAMQLSVLTFAAKYLSQHRARAAYDLLWCGGMGGGVKGAHELMSGG
jgi:hypothetical protein